jgi:hypothetical protein
MIPLQSHDLLSMTLVSRKCRNVYTHMLYRNVELDGSKNRRVEQMTSFLRTVLVARDLAAFVHSLQLQDWIWSTELNRP